ncbi:MAG: hypothetical protein IJF09_00555 [Ruminiclostridium sp.]|nr:hypothetical protein [Ruminiclostridium sp.]
MKYNRILAQAMDALDEKYAIETAECLLVPKKSSERNVIINAEDLVEMKIKSKKSGFIAKIVAVAAAFICVATVSVFLIMNNNKVQVLGSSTTSESQFESTSEETSSHPRDENATFGIKLSVKNDLPTEYNGDKLVLDACVINSTGALDYSFLVFVNGIKADYTVTEKGKSSPANIFHAEKEEEHYTTIEFSPVNCKKGEKAIVSVELMMDPEYMLDSTEYVQFNPHHNITGLLPFEIAINVDSPVNEELIPSDDVTQNVISEDLAKEFTSYSHENTGSPVSLLDSSVFFRFKKEDFFEAYINATDTLNLEIQALGREGRYIIGVYVNHNLLRAFGDKYYSYCNIKKGTVTTIKAEIDVSHLDGLNHVYIIAIPYDVAESDKRLIPIKTATKLLQITDNDISDNESTDKTTSSDISSIPESVYTTQNNISTDDSLTEVPETEAPYISGVVAVRDNKVIAKSNDSICVFNADSLELLNEFSFAAGDKVDVIDSHVVIYGLNGKYIKLYDFRGNFVKEIIPPSYDNGCYCLSDDGTQIVYSYCNNESGTTYLYMDSINFDSKRLVKEIYMSDTTGSVVGIPRIMGFDGETINLQSSLLMQTTPTLKIANGIAIIGVNGDMENVMILDEYENLSSNYTNQENYFVVTKSWKPDPDEASDGKITICEYGTKKHIDFICEEPDDNHYAYLSENGRYIAVVSKYADSDKITFKIYDFKTREKIAEEEYNSTDFDVKFSENESCAYIVAEGKINKIHLK